MDKAMDSMWQALSEEILSGVKEWRLARLCRKKKADLIHWAENS